MPRLLSIFGTTHHRMAMARQKPNPPRKRGARRGRPQKGGGGKKPAESYYIQPGKRGTVVVLHRAVGNRASPKVCGVMPSRAHGKALVDQLRRAESALHDLFYEATDDGIEALEAVLAASRDAVFARLPVDGEDGPGMEEMAAERERLQRELDSRTPNQRAG